MPRSTFAGSIPAWKEGMEIEGAKRTKLKEKRRWNAERMNEKNILNEKNRFKFKEKKSQ